MKRRQLALVISAMLGTTNLVTASDEDIFQLSLEELLDLKVEGATKTSQPVQSVPASINIFDKQAIARTGAKTLIDTLRFVPGFQTIRTDDYTTPTIAARGRFIGSSGREVVLLVDGIKIENWLTGGGLVTFGRMSTANIEKIEFIRGPLSQVYGANAINGVISVTTKRGSNSLSLTSGTNTEYELNLLYSLANDKNEHRIFISLIDEPGEEYFVESPFNSTTVSPRDSVEGLQLKYDYQSEHWSLMALHTENQYDNFYSIGGFREDFGGHNNSYSAIQTTFNFEIFSALKSQIKIGYSDWARDIDSAVTDDGVFDGLSAPNSLAPYLFRLTLAEEQIWFNFQADYNYSDKTQFQFGTEFKQFDAYPVETYNNYDTFEVVANSYPVTYYGNFDNFTLWQEPYTEEQKGIYLQAIHSMTEKLSLTAGLRYDDYDYAGNNLSPRLAMINRINEYDSIKLLYSHAFRAPTSTELFTKNNPTLIGSETLKPEEVETLEVIWLTKRGATLYQVSIFENTFIDNIVQILQGTARTFENTGDQKSSGIELNWVTPINEQLLFRINFSHLLEKPDEQFRLSDNTGALVLDYSGEQWSLTSDIEYVSSRYFLEDVTEQRIEIGPYYLVNMNYNHRLNDDWSFSVNLRNATNKKYFSPTLGSSKTPIPMRGREFSLQVKLDF